MGPEVGMNSINEIETDTTNNNNNNPATTNGNKTSTLKPVKKSRIKNQSILQLKLGSLALKISYIGMIAAAFTFLILCIRLFIEELGIKKLPWTNTYFKYILSLI